MILVMLVFKIYRINGSKMTYVVKLFSATTCQLLIALSIWFQLSCIQLLWKKFDEKFQLPTSEKSMIHECFRHIYVIKDIWGCKMTCGRNECKYKSSWNQSMSSYTPGIQDGMRITHLSLWNLLLLNNYWKIIVFVVKGLEH